MTDVFKYFAGSGFPVTTMIMVMAVILIFVALMMYMPALTRRIFHSLDINVIRDISHFRMFTVMIHWNYQMVLCCVCIASQVSKPVCKIV